MCTIEDVVLELGPCSADEAASWTRFARRIILELRSDEEIGETMSPDLVRLWCHYIDEWDAEASQASADSRPFRWSNELEPEVGEFLLHGLDRCLHSKALSSAVTPAESAAHRGFTMTVVRAFVDSLASEGESCEHYVDQVLTSFGGYIDA